MGGLTDYENNNPANKAQAMPGNQLFGFNCLFLNVYLFFIDDFNKIFWRSENERVRIQAES